jgi:hypothetical protein
MKRLFDARTTATGLLLACASLTSALAAPIVAAGSSYSMAISGTGFAGFTLGNLVFDGAAESRTEGGRTLSITESQQDLGGGVWKISLSLLSDTDLSPGDTIAFSFGHQDPLDLLQAVSLTSLRLQVTGFNAQGQPVSANPDVLALLSPPFRSPWGGAVGDPPSSSIAFVGLPWDVRSATFDLTVAGLAVPEPGVPALLGAALLAWALTRRRV